MPQMAAGAEYPAISSEAFRRATFSFRKIPFPRGEAAGGEGVATRCLRKQTRVATDGGCRKTRSPRLATRAPLDAWGPMGRGIPRALRPKFRVAVTRRG